MNGIECANATIVQIIMLKNKIDNYLKRSEYVEMWAMSITRHDKRLASLSKMPYWVPNIIGTLGGNSVKFSI